VARVTRRSKSTILFRSETISYFPEVQIPIAYIMDRPVSPFKTRDDEVLRDVSTYQRTSVDTDRDSLLRPQVQTTKDKILKQHISRSRSVGNPGQSIRVGDQAPSFVLEDQNGTPTDLSEVLSSCDYVVLHFFPDVLSEGECV
jgi:hypothetical protein